MSVKVSDLIKPFEDCTVSGDFSDWCDKLELVAKLQSVTSLHTFLPLFLTGPSFAVYKQLGEEAKSDFTKLKAELTTAFGLNKFHAYEQLKTRNLMENETVDVYVADLQRLAALMGHSDSDPLVKCAFVSGLPEDIAIQLKSIASVEDLSVADLVARARMMLSTRSVQPSLCAVGRIHLNTEPQHGEGHKFGKRPGYRELNYSRRDREEKRLCYRCHKPGHIARNCMTLLHKQGNDAGGVSSAPDAPQDM